MNEPFKFSAFVSAIDLVRLDFRAVSINNGEDVILVSKVSKADFDELCAHGAALEDWEDDGHGEDDGNTEAVMTTDGYSS